MSLRKGDRIELIERDDDFGDGWYLGKHIQNSKTGLFPEGENFGHVGIMKSLTLKSLHYNHTKDHPSLCYHNGDSYEDCG